MSLEHNFFTAPFREISGEILAFYDWNDTENHTKIKQQNVTKIFQLIYCRFAP